MTTAAIIVAAGRGTRIGGDVPKQWRLLRGRTLVARTLDSFLTCARIDRIILVLHTDDMAMDTEYGGHAKISTVAGGGERPASVLAGLRALEHTATTRVLIHDVARPLLNHALIGRVLDAVSDTCGAAPGLPVSDALWRSDGALVAGSVDRAGLYRAQTPQGFGFRAILAAHRAHSGSAADDVEIARAAGLAVTIVPGDARNLKITTEADFGRAEQLMGGEMDIRVGNGFDVHRFGPGDGLMLCGVQIPHGQALQGHSDADVGMHALTDAIYGAIAQGDIGRHFPPTDPQWRGADSRIFLEHAMSQATERGFSLSNADVTLICEAPKIAPHARAMAARLAEILAVPADRISVKATTTERLGFTGRREGIAATATATLLKT